MNTSPETSLWPRLRKGQIIARTWRWILMAMVGVAVLTACSVTRIAYNRAPTVAYWWIDGYVDLSNGQSTQLRSDIDRFLAWHRRAELPMYANQLAQWQTLFTRNMSADRVCSEFDFMREAYLRMLNRGLEPLTALALQLTPAQLQHMQRHQAKRNQGFEEKYLTGDAADRLDERLDRYADRYETLYGALTPQQTRLLRTDLQHSRFDPQRSLAEHQRRQTSLVQVIQKVQAAQGSAQRPAPVSAVDALRGWAQELLNPSTPGYADYQESLVREGCTQFATLHNSTSPEQRAHAVQLLKGYEEDLRALSAQD